MTQNVSYITNPGYPTAYTVTAATTCSYSVTPLSSSICQLRLDFDAFNLAIVSTTGACTDTFAVTMGSGVDYPKLCGINTGHHIYLDTGRATSDQTLSFTVAAAGSATYKIKVSQIECSATYRAPPDCYQYYTGRNGRVKSFNRASGRMLHNLRYQACVRREPGTCGINWSVTSTTEYAPLPAFALNADAMAATGKTAVAYSTYISIPGSDGGSYSGTILAQLDDETVSAVIPATGLLYSVDVFTVAPAAADNAYGFDLTYNQAGCLSSYANNVPRIA